METFGIQAHGSRLATRKQALWILTEMAFAMLSSIYILGLKPASTADGIRLMLKMLGAGILGSGTLNAILDGEDPEISFYLNAVF